MPNWVAAWLPESAVLATTNCPPPPVLSTSLMPVPSSFREAVRRCTPGEISVLPSALLMASSTSPSVWAV